MRPQCVHLYTLGCICVWVWSWRANSEYSCGWCAWTCGVCFFENKDSNHLWLNAHVLKVELKQFILFFKNSISLVVACKAWWEGESFFLFFLETLAFSFTTIFLFKEVFSFKATSFYFSTKIILFFKLVFPSQRSFNLDIRETFSFFKSLLTLKKDKILIGPNDV